MKVLPENREAFERLDDKTKNLYLKFLELQIKLVDIIPLFSESFPAELFGFKIKKASRDECFNHPCVVTVGIQDTKEKLYVLNIATKDNDDIQVRMLDDGKIQRFNDKNKFEVATKNGMKYDFNILLYEILIKEKNLQKADGINIRTKKRKDSVLSSNLDEVPHKKRNGKISHNFIEDLHNNKIKISKDKKIKSSGFKTKEKF